MDAEIGVFGGSGFYKFLNDVREIEVNTPFGKPSAPIAIASVEGRKVAFLPRHGKKHELPPHMINYRANLWAMKMLGVTRIFGPCAAGSLQKKIKPGDFVVCDQVVDFTRSRKDTFYEGPETRHIAFADPYCNELRSLVLAAAKKAKVKAHDKGAMVVMEGPRFSTRAESAFYSKMGWDVINMTGYPECVLARELELCYANISLITDYDVGLKGVPPVTHEQVIRVFNENNEKLRALLMAVIPMVPKQRAKCECGTALQGTKMG